VKKNYCRFSLFIGKLKGENRYFDRSLHCLDIL
jgi:hypothetical protein